MTDPYANVYRHARHLPHFQNPGCWYHVTFRPRFDRGLTPQCRQIVLDACRFYEGKLWELAAIAIMPRSGEHLLCQPLGDPKTDPKKRIGYVLGRVKGYSAKRINELCGTSGPFWIQEYRERQIRSEADFWGIVAYIANNPVKEGLAKSALEYPWFWAHPEVRWRVPGMVESERAEPVGAGVGGPPGTGG